MLREIVIVCITIQISALFAFGKDSERVLVLQDSIATGLSNSQELLVLKEQISIAQQRVSEAMSLRYPKIDFNLSASESQSDSPMVLAPSFDNIYIPAGNAQYYTTRFTLWQYLYAAGRYTNNLRLAEANLSQAQGQAEIVKINTVKQITNSFYSLIAFRDKIKIYESVLEEIKPKPDMVSYGSKLKFDLMDMRHDYEKAKLIFLDNIGAELNTEFELNGDLKAPTEDYDYNKCLAWAMQYRPELRQTQFQEAIDSLRVNLSMAERFPTITMGANYEWIGNQFPLTKTNWSATVNLNVPIFDGWASWARIKQRRFQAREGKVRRSKIEDRIRFEVKQAFVDYTYWRERLLALEQQPQSSDISRKLDGKLSWIYTSQQAILSKSVLEWAMGKYLMESNQSLPQE